MTDKKLQRCNQLSKLLKNEIETLSDPRRFEKGKLGEALNSLLSQDEEFKNSFMHIISSVKERLEKEYKEL